MNNSAKLIVVAALAVLLLVFGMGMGKAGGRSDETNYTTPEEAAAQEKVIAELAEKRGERPAAAETPEPSAPGALTPEIPMQELEHAQVLARAGYDAQRELLLVEYRLSGLRYLYHELPQEEWEKLLASDNQDKWFDVMIKDSYRFEQLN